MAENIRQDLKQAMFGKNAETVSVLRMLIAAMRNKEITLRKDGHAELSDEQIAEVIGSEVKKRRDSVEAYIKGGRQELADKENSEIKILEKYLPEKMSDEELEKAIREIIGAGADDFGKTMARVMAKVKGKVDGAKAGAMVKKILAE
ncbi:MAG: GatB/YqeY domain-containing protein [bacterium]